MLHIPCQSVETSVSTSSFSDPGCGIGCGKETTGGPFLALMPQPVHDTVLITAQWSDLGCGFTVSARGLGHGMSACGAAAFMSQLMSEGKGEISILGMPFSSILPVTHPHKRRPRDHRVSDLDSTALNLQMGPVKWREGWGLDPALPTAPAGLPLPAAFQSSRFPLVSPPLFTGSLSLATFISLCSSPHSASLRILTVTCMKSTMTLYLSLICAFSASCFWTSFGSVAPD